VSGRPYPASLAPRETPGLRASAVCGRPASRGAATQASHGRPGRPKCP
jgi:hypothetical protein